MVSDSVKPQTWSRSSPMDGEGLAMAKQPPTLSSVKRIPGGGVEAGVDAPQQ
jgi:hypothetical protein